MLSIPAEVVAMIETGRIAIRWMVRVDLDGGAVGFWADAYAMTWGGVTYQPLAGNIKVGDVETARDLSADSLDVTLSPLLASVAGMMDGVDWHQRPVVVSVAFLGDGGVVAHVMTRFVGFLDKIDIADASDTGATMLAKIESTARGLTRKTGRVRSDADQRRVSASDRFYDQAVASSVESEIYWGRKGPQTAAPRAVGSGGAISAS